MDRMARLTETIGMLMAEEFSGHIKINFSQGSIGRVEKSEEFEDVATAYAEDRGRNENRGETRQR